MTSSAASACHFRDRKVSHAQQAHGAFLAAGDAVALVVELHRRKNRATHSRPALPYLFRLELAALVMLSIYFAQSDAHPRLRNIWPFVYLGFFGVILNQGLFTVGLNYTTSDHSAVIIAFGPVIIFFSPAH